MFISHTKMSILFGTGWSTNSISKVQACSREITNEPCTSSKIRSPWHKPMTTSLKTNNDTEMNTLDVEKIKNRKQNFEDEATNMMQLEKEDTQRSNFNNNYRMRKNYIQILLFAVVFKKLTCTI